jgi:hypothetical protein
MAPSNNNNNNNNNSNPSSRFDELCKCLERNDPAVVDVNLISDDKPFGCGPRLGAALQNNTVVTTLSLSLSKLLAEKDNSPEEMMRSTALLLQFIQTSLSLQTVLLHFAHFSDALAEMILNAMVQNPAISALKWNAIDFQSLPLLTTFLQAKSASLKMLEVYFSYDPRAAEEYEMYAMSVYHNLGRDVGPPQRALLPELATMEAASQAMAELTVLKNLTLRIGPRVELFLLPLVGHGALCALDVHWVRPDYSSTYTAGIDALSQVIGTCPNLQHVTLTSCVFLDDPWRTLVQGVQGRAVQHSPLKSLVLAKCRFGTATLNMLSQDPASGQDPLDPHTAFPCTVGALKLLNCEFANGNIHEPNMTGLLLSSVRLHTLKLSWTTPRNETAVPVPKHFLEAMRKNGSLTSVVIDDGKTCIPLKRVGRYIAAMTSRNKMTPLLLTSTIDHPAESVEVRSLYPTLMAVAKQSPQMAPNTLFMCVLAARDGFGPVQTCKKRIAPLSRLWWSARRTPEP